MDLFPDSSDIQPNKMVKKTNKKKQKLEASLVGRLLAFIIDTILLAIIGILLSTPFSGVFFSLGFNGWWIGFLISLAYYSVSATSRFKGQSLGARILGISTISSTGGYLNMKSAFIRSTLLLIIFYNSYISGLLPSYLVILIIGGVILFSYIATFFVYILLNTQHRGLHDIAAGSMVVNKKAFNALTAKEKRSLNETSIESKKPLKISAALIALIVVGGIVLTIINPLKNSFFGELQILSTHIEKQTGLESPSITVNTYFEAEGKTTKILVVTVSVDKNTFQDVTKLKTLDTQIKKEVIASYPDVNQVDEIKVVFNSGYTIGIWTMNENAGEDSTPIQDIK